MAVSVSFFGAARTVTGSCVLLTTDRANLLVDCGMFQGNKTLKALDQLGDERAVPRLKKLTSGDLDGRLMRLAEEAVQKITKDFE